MMIGINCAGSPIREKLLTPLAPAIAPAALRTPGQKNRATGGGSFEAFKYAFRLGNCFAGLARIIDPG
jgi:hypothetical protein